ncbi:hypothetical protein [Phyllobacterium phragmitis]|nr:hypothetical protein [Phyllobacterium phragmitis]
MQLDADSPGGLPKNGRAAAPVRFHYPAFKKPIFPVEEKNWKKAVLWS